MNFYGKNFIDIILLLMLNHPVILLIQYLIFHQSFHFQVLDVFVYKYFQNFLL